MANKRFIVRHGLDNSGDNSVVNTITNVAEPVNNSDAATKYYVDTHTTGGTVTSVTATSPVESTGGTAPVISLGTGANGQLVIGTGTGFTKSTLTAGTGVSIANASGSITISATGSGGDVVGPASATDNAVTRFDSTTGKLIQNSTVTLDDNGNFDNVNSIVLDNTPATLPTSAGTMSWDDGDGVPSVILKGGNSTLQIGTQEYARVYNDSGSTITIGQAVYISGAQGNRVAVKLAQANTEANSFGTLGLVAETIASGAEGFVLVSGALYKLNTLGLTAGAVVYLSPTTAGAYTTTKPQAPDQLVVLGFVERVSSTVGSIYVKVDNGYEIDELHDVRITSPVSGNTLIYDATTSPTGVWKNASLTAGTGISVTNGAGSITIGNTGVTSVSGTSPVVSSGGATPAISLASGYGDTQNPYGSKTANYFLASPDGSAGVPTFRAIVAADIPTLNQNTTGTAANITATSNTTLTTLSSLVSIGTITTGTWNASAIGVAYGGTGLTTLTAGYIPYGNGTSAFGSSANLFWDSTNSRLGVGTASPSEKLSIKSATGINSVTDIASLTNPSQTSAGVRVLFNNGYGNLGAISSFQLDNGAGADNGVLAFQTASDAVLSTKMTILDTGNVGIGVTSPSQKLSVSNNIILGTAVSGQTATPSFIDTSTNYSNGTTRDKCKIYLYNSGTEQYGFSVGSSADIQYHSNSIHDFYIANSLAVRINSTGLGIGTSSPAFKLHTYIASGTSMFKFESGANAGIYGYWTRPNQSYIQALNLDNNGDKDFSLYDATNGQVADRYYPSSTGYRAFFTNGSERMRIDSSGNVGIGTSSPSAKLDVNGQVRAAYASGFQVDNAGTMLGKLYYSGGLILDRAASTSLFIAQNGSNQVTLDSSGNLGLGTSNPLARLDIVGDATPNGNGLAFGHANTAGYKWIQSFASQALYINPLGNNVIFNRDGGSVGIGTVSPASKLMISGTGTGAWFTVNRTDSGTNIIDFTQSGSRLGYVGYIGSDLTINQASAANTIFNTNNTERMRIDSNGNVGIGTSTVVANFGGYKTLELNGTTGGLLSLDSNGTNNLQMYTNGSTVNVVTIGALPLTFGTNSTERMRIDSSGNVGIGTSSPDGKLEVSGKLKVRGTTSANDLVQVWGVSGGSGSYTTLELIKTADTSGNFIFRGFTAGGTGTAPKIAFGNWSATPFDGAQMTLDTSSGNVGIGTSSPTNKLQVNGVMVGNNASGSYTKGFGGILTTTSTSTPTGGSSGDFTLIY